MLIFTLLPELFLLHDDSYFSKLNTIFYVAAGAAVTSPSPYKQPSRDIQVMAVTYLIGLTIGGPP